MEQTVETNEQPLRRAVVRLSISELFYQILQGKLTSTQNLPAVMLLMDMRYSDFQKKPFNGSGDLTLPA